MGYGDTDGRHQAEGGGPLLAGLEQAAPTPGFLQYSTPKKVPVPLITRATRLRAQPFMLAYELIDILKLGAAARLSTDLGWLILPNTHQVIGFVQDPPPLSEDAIREAWSTWADVVGARSRSELQVVEGHVYLRAVADAYGDHLVRVSIEAEIPASPHAAARRLV